MEIEIASGRKIGDGNPCYIIAEIGSNHNHDFDLALELIEAAAGAGVDAVKFQTFRAKDHYSTKAPGFSYLSSSDTYKLIESLELDRSWHQPLKAAAEALGLDFLSSPCDIDAIEELEQLQVVAYKVASFDLPDTTLIARMARTARPIILSTGMADWMDIQRGVDTVRGFGNDQIVLLQCTSLYPAPVGLSNLRSMASMRGAFNCLVGYSDHTEGEHICLGAVAQGACVIEKHFSMSRKLPGPDHPFAIEPSELKQMVLHIREIESALGDGSKAGPRPEEMEMFQKGRRSLHVLRDIEIGEIIHDEDLVVKRPGIGIPPHMRSFVVGRRARVALKRDQWITWEMI